MESKPDGDDEGGGMLVRKAARLKFSSMRTGGGRITNSLLVAARASLVRRLSIAIRTECAQRRRYRADRLSQSARCRDSNVDDDCDEG